MIQKQIIFDILRLSCNGYIPSTTIEENTGVSEKYTKPIGDVEWTRVNDLIKALDDRMLSQLSSRLHLLGIPPEKRREFDAAVAELKRLMTRFAEMGGRPLKEMRNHF